MGYKAALGASIALLLLVQASTAFAFGAFAVDDSPGTSAGDVGYGTGYASTRKQAERYALKSCKAAGNDNCEIAVWFETCGAYVGDNVTYGVGFGKTRRDAERKAMVGCPNCKVVVAECEQ